MKKLTATGIKIIILIITSFILLNIIWLKNDTIPPHFDAAIHLSNVMDYSSFLKSGQLLRFIGHYSYYPPLAYWITSFFFLIFGVSADIGVISLSFFLVIMIISAYLIGKEIKDERFGLILIISMIGLPFLMSQTREYQLDFPLTGLLILNIYLFFKSDFLKIRSFAFWFAIVSGLAFLTKWTYLPFFAFMMIYAILTARKKDRKMILDNVIFVFLVTYLVAGWWYIKNFTNIRSDFLSNIRIAIKEKDPSIFSLGSLVFYPISLLTNHLRLLLSVLFAVSFWIIRKINNKKISFLLYISGFYLVVMTFFINKDHRFIEPITPLLVFIIAFALVNIKNHFYRNTAIIIFVFISVFNFTTVTFNLNLFPQSVDIKLFKLVIPVYKSWGYTVGPPKNENWHVEDIINKYSSYKKVLVIIPEDKMFFNYANFSYFGKLYSPQTVIKAIIFNKKQAICSPEFDNFDIIVLDGNQIYLSFFYNICCSKKSAFTIAEPSFFLPDMSRVWIFKK